MRTLPNHSRITFVFLAAVLLAFAPLAQAQIGPPVEIGGGAGGIYIDASGTVRYRQADANKELDAIRERAQKAVKGAKDELCFISLPHLFAQVRQAVADGKPLDDHLRYLGGMTSVQYVIVDAANKDLLIAGPFEPVDARNPTEPVGQRTSRPVLQLDDLVVALRSAQQNQAQPIGCSIDQPADLPAKWAQIMHDNTTHASHMAALSKGLSPQEVRFFGTADNTRLAFVCIAADFKLKRISLGLDAAPAGVGSAVDSSRYAAFRLWFECCYDPLLVSADSDIYEHRGQRLQ